MTRPSRPRWNLAPQDTLKAGDLDAEWRLSAVTPQVPQIAAPESTPAN
ncbi:MAG: hypothetical protein MZV49_19190 [Rhodopseudomonas palustris]|nr:hypothetical protein [Rhodopseudomonas palustris]